MTCNAESYIITLQGTVTQGGLLKAYVTDTIEGDIRPDGDMPADKSCQFYLHTHFDTKYHVNRYRFESVEHEGYNLYWNENNKKVTLRKCDGNDDALADNQRIWWSTPAPSVEMTIKFADFAPDSKLLKPFAFRQPEDTFPYVLVFDKDPNLKCDRQSAVETGQFKLDKMA